MQKELFSVHCILMKIDSALVLWSEMCHLSLMDVTLDNLGAAFTVF